ncbi:hypothetical protein BS47DRAFT_1374300 [Hydnum rufescens UP504]|uniref:Uncharacterized protein n=1 Tax=Hydnum rufescens UP504 TaxID=1448309 RepID=A0A9P6AGR9_9AGAM|nr:hypothetical protein BS47DRAFT_1374300 [Hydnum rufescens UP504]
MKAIMPKPQDDLTKVRLRVPNSSLDSCGKSFVAANGNRIKTPGDHFSDTGVIAAVCRHDRVIVYASMWTPVGILYDIGCQIHRSALKWDLLPQWMPCIIFAISVFHVYGHQWVCQLWYHPWKGDVWGLMDGEGCECLWSDL